MRKQTSSSKSSRAWKERRKKAERLFASGERQAVVARILGVSRQCVHNWHRLWMGARDGQPARDGASRSTSGRKPKLTPQQLAEVDASLRKGPRHFGYRCDRWTLELLAEAINRLTGIRFHPSSVWRILRSLGWSLRYPNRPPDRPRVYIAREWVPPSDGKKAGHRT